ncbi:Hypothetical Protein FCC1311_105852 [Hondaea fermentalgiana]|uniref:Uncharacterized protein n=1 Tax=Hondaea fermentalgiana TaxID=2315210 RepID=A0A2R5GU21_9STRA|nr:Hypothetical Protein FCC1311_105852 [Hondaea fermentalgiana]|eukprot:GBG34362.1 Hypothetical Protein FCC1311_105852 [Hondaea fermentalgiana]
MRCRVEALEFCHLDTAGLARVLVVGAHEFDAEAVADVLQDALPGVSPELSVVSAADLPSAEENDSSLAASAWSAVRAEARRRAALALEALEASEANDNGDQKSSSAVGLRLAVGMFWDLLELDPETQMPIVWVEIVDADSGQRGSACQVGAIRARSAGVPPLHAYLRHEAIELAWEQFVSRA